MLEDLTNSVLYKYLEIYKLTKGASMWECYYSEEMALCFCIWVEIILS